MRQNQQAALDHPTMDMTPMIDVVFLLIIFFLCVDFRVLEAKLSTYLPRDSGTSQRDVEPRDQLNLRILCEAWGDELPRNPAAQTTLEQGRVVRPPFRLVGHRVRYELGPRGLADLAQLKVALGALVADPSRRRVDPRTPGQTLPPALVIDPGVDTTYEDVTAVVDLALQLGFAEITFSRRG